MIEWAIIAAVCVYALSLARRLATALEELRIERHLRKQAERREAEADEARRRVAALNWRLARHQPAGGRYYDN